MNRLTKEDIINNVKKEIINKKGGTDTLSCFRIEDILTIFLKQLKDQEPKNTETFSPLGEMVHEVSKKFL